jgi:hypothetical protein
MGRETALPRSRQIQRGSSRNLTTVAHNPFIGHSLCVLLPNRRRRSLTGLAQSGTEDSGGRQGSIDSHHGHS